MEYSDKLINGGLHIKVNKKQKLINVPPRYTANDIQLINDQFPPQRFSKNSIFSNIQKDTINNRNRYNEISNTNTNNTNNNFSQNENAMNYYTEGNNQLNSTNEELKYQKININKRFNKNSNKITYSSLTNSKYKKKFVDNDNGNKLNIYKSETQYPFYSKKESIEEIGNKSMKNMSISPGIKTVSLKHYKPHKKNNLEKKEVKNKNYFINDFDNNIPLKNDYNSTEKSNNYSELTFNKLKHNFYKSYKKDKNSISNYANNTNYTNNTNDNFQNYSNDNNIIYNNKTEGYIKKTKNINIKKNNNYNKYENNSVKTESNDKKLLNIYKNKLINIFVRLMMNIFLKYKQKLFGDFINEIKKTINNNKKYKTKKIDFQNNNLDDIEVNNRINYYYIKKNKINVPDNIYNNNKINNINININKYNLAKSLSLNKNYSTVTMFKKTITNKNSVLKNEKINRRIFINNKFKIMENDNDNNSIKKDSLKNIYIPAKSRYNGYNYISRQKDNNIFDGLKINKSTRLFEQNPNMYQNQNINTQINNFYSTNNSNFFISKINSFSSIMNTEKQRPKNFIHKGSQQNNQNLSNKQNNYKENNNVKCEIFKNRKRFTNVVYKKIFSKEKNSENNTESKNENNMKKNNNENIFMKRMERVYNKINNNNNYEGNVNQTYSIRRKYKNMNNNMNNDMNKNQFQYATIVNYTCEANDNNYNNIDISNDINNYNLEDIDKPTNMMYMKHDNDNKFYNDNDNEEEDNDINVNNDDNNDIDIKNLLQLKTNDKRLYLNFNYIIINKYDNNKNKNYKFKKNKIKYKIANPYSIYIPSYTNDDIINLSIISNNKSFKEMPEKINKNLNKYIKKRKIKSGILKLDHFINDKIYEYKSIILKNLKSIKFKSIIYNIMQSHSLDILKKYFDIFKSNTTLLKEENNINNILFEETDDKNNCKNIILDKKNINYIIDVNDFDDKNHQESKKKLKYLVKKINERDHEENNQILNTSFDQGDLFENNRNINMKIPLWKSVQDININNNKKIYMKKSVKSVKNKSNKSNGNDNDYDINERKIEIFRNKIINFLFSKINK